MEDDDDRGFSDHKDFNVDDVDKISMGDMSHEENKSPVFRKEVNPHQTKKGIIQSFIVHPVPVKVDTTIKTSAFDEIVNDIQKADQLAL